MKERFDCDLEYHWLLRTITCFAHIECNPATAAAAHIPINVHKHNFPDTLDSAQNLNDIKFNDLPANWICWDSPTKPLFANTTKHVETNQY